jgi:carnitine 3-dehydrogenase
MDIIAAGVRTSPAARGRASQVEAAMRQGTHGGGTTDPAAGAHDPGAATAAGRPAPHQVRRVAVVGAGLIGSRWTALFLAAGMEVRTADPAPGAEDRLRADVTRCLPALARLGAAAGAGPSAGGPSAGTAAAQGPTVPGGPAAAEDAHDCQRRLTFFPRLEDAVADADFVQECVADDEQLKLAVLRRIDAACPPQAVIASSTSGIVPTRLQTACAHPERLLVGHPFNPAHIIPLVEVVAGEATGPDAVDWAIAFYTRLGKKPLRVRKEAEGFVSNRMQEAIWREMFHLVNDGIATTGELDAAISDGPGLRWALYGPAFIYMLQGGRGGFAYALEQFDPAVVAGCSHNVYPPLTPELTEALDTQTRVQAQGRTLEEWEALRDEFLIRVIELKRELLGE